MLSRLSVISCNRIPGFVRCFAEVKKSGIYTKTGDKGSSSLYNGERRKKYDDVFHALGNTDELNSFIGFARGFAESSNNGLAPKLIEIQSRLFDLGAAIATPPKTSESKKVEKTKFPEDNITILEQWIDELDAKLPPFKTFTIPSSAPGGASLQMCRSICRRAERSVVPLVERDEVDSSVQRYLNRLSDFLYVASRWSVEFDHIEEVPWYILSQKMDENNSFSDEFIDVLISHPLRVQPTTPTVSNKEKSSALMVGMQKQLEQTCFEISAWCEQILQEHVSSDILTSLRDGVVLCRVAEILYPSKAPLHWIQFPQEYMDYNINITAFSDHCLAIGIDESMVVKYTVFDERDLPRLSTCLLEYIDFFNNMNSHELPPPEKEQISDPSSVPVDASNQLDHWVEPPVTETLLQTESPKKERRGLFACCRP